MSDKVFSHRVLKALESVREVMGSVDALCDEAGRDNAIGFALKGVSEYLGCAAHDLENLPRVALDELVRGPQ